MVTFILQKVPIKPECVEHGKLYIWHLPHGEKKVVWKNEAGDALAEYDIFNDEDHWYFENDLAGVLYGPIELAP